MDLDIATLRMMERIIVVTGGIISIVLGYRLFFVIKESSSEAKLKLSEIMDVGFKRVGPGVFFSLFGAWILAMSLTEKIQFENYSKDNVVKTIRNVDHIAMSLKRIESLIKVLPEETQQKIIKELSIIELQVFIPNGNTRFIGNHNKLPKNGLVDG